MTMTAETSLPTLPFKVWTKGKVRDVYDLGEELLIVASDRISAYDYVLPTPVPQKGVVLCQTSNFWFDRLKAVCPNHLLAAAVKDFPPEVRGKCGPALEGRTVLVKKAKRVDIECVVRGYLAGSGLKEYNEKGTVCGIKLPAGLKNSSKLPEAIFTPSTKAEIGMHDENITDEQGEKLVGKETYDEVKRLSLKILSEIVTGFCGSFCSFSKSLEAPSIIFRKRSGGKTSAMSCLISTSVKYLPMTSPSATSFFEVTVSRKS